MPRNVDAIEVDSDTLHTNHCIGTDTQTRIRYDTQIRTYARPVQISIMDLPHHFYILGVLPSFYNMILVARKVITSPLRLRHNIMMDT